MSIRITGYDIVGHHIDPDRNVVQLQGVVHLEVEQEPIDMPFEAVKLSEQLGFNEFYFKDPDEVDNREVYNRSSEIRDCLNDILLDKGFETGEYEVNLEF